MNVYDFNSKINLPAVCQEDGIKGYEFIKMERFGWFAYNKNRSEIKHIFELYPENDRPLLYKRFVRDDRRFLDFPIQYSEHVQNRLNNSYLYLLNMTILWKHCIAEANGGKVYVKNHLFDSNKFFEHFGIKHLLASGVGIINKYIKDHKIFGSIDWIEKAEARLLIPSFCTPQHICSLEVGKASDVDDKRITVMTLKEKGWYGTLDHCIQPSLKSLCKNYGNTWDYKCDYWTNGVSDVSENMSVEACVKVWTEARHTKFSKDIIDVIINSGHQEEIKHHLRKLDRKQIEFLEKKMKLPLMENWKAQQYDEMIFTNCKVIIKDNRYYIERKHITEEFTNFVIKITGLVKKSDGVYRQGYLCFDEGQYPFLIENKAFMSYKAFNKMIYGLFFDNGLGIPLIHTNFCGYLLDTINRFNYHTMNSLIPEDRVSSKATNPVPKLKP